MKKNQNKQKNENNIQPEGKKLILFTVVIAVGILLFLLIHSFTTPDMRTQKADNQKMGQLVIAKEPETFSKPDDPLWDEADAEYEESMPNAILINDDNSALSMKDFLPMKAHFLKSEAIGTFLKEQGLECSEVTVIENSLEKDNHNSFFCVSLLEYPDIILQVTWYGITEEFAFNLTNG